jgi:ABC-2 type transport system permease protein
VLIDTLPYYALSTSGTSIIPSQDYPYVWVAGVFIPQTLFMQFIAILIAAGAMSEEYEQGTAELLLSKPVSKKDYFFGKLLGGYLLLMFILALNAILSVVSANVTFGPQLGLDALPGIYAIQGYSTLLFFTLSFMLGDLVRRSSLAYIFSSAVFFSTTIIGFYMRFIYELTGRTFYHLVDIYLPTTPLGSILLQYAIPRLPANVQDVLSFFGSTNIVEPSFEFSAALIFVYSLVGLIISLLYFTRADISRKIS